MAVKGTKPRRRICITAGDEELQIHIGRPGCSEDCAELSALFEALAEASGAEVESMALGGEGNPRQVVGVSNSQAVGGEELARRQANAQQPARQTNG